MSSVPGEAEARAGGGGLRVLYFIAYPQRMAGANRSLYELVTNLPPDVEPQVLSVAEGPVVDAYRRAGVPCTVLPVTGALNTYGRGLLRTSVLQRVGIALRDLLPFEMRLRRWIEERGIDVVHVNDPRGAMLAAPAARLAGRPVVAHLRGEIPFGTVAQRAYELAGHRIITVSEGVRRTLSPAGRRKAVTVYNGIRELAPPGRSIPWLGALRERGVLVVSCFASVVPFKGQHHLLRAAAILDQRGWRERVAFVSVGDLVPEHAEYQQWLRELAAELGVRNFTFAGWQDDPFAFYPHTDISVLPSVSSERLEFGGRTREVLGNEGFPRTHLEAMRFGLPIVGTRIAGVPEQVEHGVTGLLVDERDPMQLADALEHLLRSPELRRRMGEAGRARVEERFSTAAYVGGVMAVYRSLPMPGAGERAA